MANITSIKIPELAELSREEFTGAEYLVLDTGTATKKMQVSDFNRASTETATAKANAAAQSATDAAESALNAQNAAQSATDAIANARAQITQDVIDARNAKSNAESCANTARNLVNSDYALTARSYATGDAEDALGHEYREGQSTDNAKYYSEQCAAHDSAAATSETNAKASENNAKASELAAANSAESAAASARQALENATGVSEFSGSDPGLVPHSTKSNAFLRSDGKWDDTLATDDDLSALRTSLQTSFQDGVDVIYGAITAKNVIPSASTPTALATAVSAVYDGGRSLGDSEGYARGHAQGLEDGQHIVKLGSGTSYNVSSYKGYKNFTKDNFIVKINSIAVSDTMGQSSHNSGMGMRAPGTSSMSVVPSVTYNASTGAVAIGNLSGTCNNGFEPTSTVTASSTVTVTASIDVYLVY